MWTTWTNSIRSVFERSIEIHAVDLLTVVVVVVVAY